MSTKLNAEELAAQYIPDWSENDFTTKRRGFAMCVEKFAEPIADERDELREALEDVLAGWELMISAYGYDPSKEPEDSINQRARAILAKYPRTNDPA